jgi:cobalt-zinc-cadmium efflux system protein
MMCLVDGVKGVHHFHLWTIGENQVCATAHLVAEGDFEEIKKQVKHLLNQQGVFHITLELEREECEHFTCCFPAEHHFSAHGHHHH